MYFYVRRLCTFVRKFENADAFVQMRLGICVCAGKKRCRVCMLMFLPQYDKIWIGVYTKHKHKYNCYRRETYV